MDAELWSTIRRLFDVEKLSKKAIAKRLGIARWTVRRALGSQAGAPPENRGAKPRPSKLDPFKGYLAERLKDYPELSAAKLWIEIKTRGYGGSDTILREWINEIRPAKKEAYLRIETLPGEFAQVDWMNVASISIGNAKRKLSAFVMVLSWSRLLYIEFTLSQCLEDFLSCHQNAFRFFGGIPKKCLYDNLKAVCLYRHGPEVRFNPRFMELAGVFGFEPVLCNVRRGNEKGKVENSIKYVRSSFLAGRDIVSWPNLSMEAIYWRDEVANVRIHGTTRERPITRWEEEKRHLRALPEKEFDCSIIRPVKATSQAHVRFDGNRYSVPSAWAYKNATLKATAHEVKVFDGTRLLAAHSRSYERGLVIENPKHYEGLIAIKKEAQATKLKDAFLTLAPEAGVYLKGLMETDLNAPHHIARIMEYVRCYGKSEVLQALIHALKFKAFGADYVKNIILQQRAARGMKQSAPITLTKKPEWANLAVEEPDLSLYDELFDKKEDRPDESNKPPHDHERP